MDAVSTPTKGSCQKIIGLEGQSNPGGRAFVVMGGECAVFHAVRGNKTPYLLLQGKILMREDLSKFEVVTP